MKKVLSCMLMVVLLTFSISMVASGVGFVPSVSYKPAPEIVDIVDHAHKDCIIITPISKVKESTVLTQEKKDAIFVQYERLSDPDTKISELVAEFKNDLVVKDLFDVTILCSELNENIKKDGFTFDIVLKTPLGNDDQIYAMFYVDGKWTKVPVINNGDGTITLTLFDEGIIALMVPAEDVDMQVPETGDNSNTLMWMVIMLASLALIVVLVIVNRRITVNENK